VSRPRGQQIIAGALVARAAMKAVNIRSLDICPWAVREGIILHYLQTTLTETFVLAALADTIIVPSGPDGRFACLVSYPALYGSGTEISGEYSPVTLRQLLRGLAEYPAAVLARWAGQMDGTAISRVRGQPCGRTAGMLSSQLSRLDEASWPSGSMGRGDQQRERGGGPRAGPSARRWRAAPSAATSC
jgi:Ppx/GppA phosphatase family